MGAAPATQAHSSLSDEKILAQADRIVQSEAFRNSRVLQRLLKFLAEKYVSGEAQQLKEYTVAVEALGRPSTYDPRHDSAVRIQVGRLRQKLAEYYRTEGSDEEIIIDLPKGHFQLTFDMRPPVLEPSPDHQKLPIGQILVYVALVVLAVWATYSTVMLRHEREVNASPDAVWTPALRQLWKPILTTNRPLILVVEDPLFFRLQTSGRSMWFRDATVNDWTQVGNSPSMQAFSKVLKNSRVDPGHFYTPIAEVPATLLLGKLLGTHQQNISLARSSQISWQDIADQNVVYVGSQPFFDVHTRGMWLEPQLMPVNGGIQNLKPGPGEPAKFADEYGPPGAENGEFYVVVTHIPGPTNTSDIIGFTSSRSPGFVGAVQWFTNSKLAKTLVEKMTKPASGEMPLYYQVLLKAKIEGGILTETSYVLDRELHLPAKSTVAGR